MKSAEELSLDFQTPPEVCRYMVSLLPAGTRTVLEPTPGIGNILAELSAFKVTAPQDYFELDKSLLFDAVVMNPPFSGSSLKNIPDGWARLDKKGKAGMKAGYQILLECMRKSNTIIALMPWFTISDSDVRLRFLKRFGIKSITALPRKTFQYARIQTCVIHLELGYEGKTEFRVFDFIEKIKSKEQKLQTELFEIL